MYRVCRVCKEEKSLEDFTIHPNGKNGRTNRCKKCTNIYKKSRKDRMYQKIADYVGGFKCSRCGIERDTMTIFDFHHLDPATKDRQISKMVENSWKDVKTELDKCIILCANCHREVHEEQRS